MFSGRSAVRCKRKYGFGCRRILGLSTCPDRRRRTTHRLNNLWNRCSRHGSSRTSQHRCLRCQSTSESVYRRLNTAYRYALPSEAVESVIWCGLCNQVGLPLSVIFVIETSPMLGLLRGLVASNFLALLNRFVNFFDFMACPLFFEIRREAAVYINFLPTTRSRFARGEALKQERHPNGYDNSFHSIRFTFGSQGSCVKRRRR